MRWEAVGFPVVTSRARPLCLLNCAAGHRGDSSGQGKGSGPIPKADPGKLLFWWSSGVMMS